MFTTKKQKFVGYKELIDAETGEVYPVQFNTIEDRDFNFNKVWLQHFVSGIDDIANQKLRLAFWLIDNLDKENQVIMTQRRIAEKSGMSLQTVNRTLKALQNSTPSFLQKINSGAYRINPDVIWKGSHSNRMGVCFEYQKVEAEKAVVEEKTKKVVKKAKPKTVAKPKAVAKAKPKAKPKAKATPKKRVASKAGLSL